MTEIVERTLALLREGTLPVMLPLVLVCLFMWILIVERINYLYGPIWMLFRPARRKELIDRKRILASAFERFLSLPSPQNRARVVKHCRRVWSPYSRFLLRALRYGPLREQDVRELHILREERRADQEIERGLLMISTFAKAAPLLGLLGTVTGMIQTFRVMMLASTSDPRALSSGISIALIATEVGLVVSLSGVIGSSWLNRRAQVLEDEIHLASMRIQQGENTEESER